jgi:gamma-tubulin complex component 2
MTFEVLEPTWDDLIAKITGGKVANVDQVLQFHSDFLSSCLNDCLVSNLELLTTVKKLLGVCSDFCYYMNDLDSLEDFDAFEDDIKKFDLGFTSGLVSLLDRISQMARENYNEKILNILYRLDFNGFYSKALDTFGRSKPQEVKK